MQPQLQVNVGAMIPVALGYIPDHHGLAWRTGAGVMAGMGADGSDAGSAISSSSEWPWQVLINTQKDK